MNENFQNSLCWNIIRFGITLIASWLVVVVIFAMCTEDELVPKYNKQMFTGGVILALSISFISSYNKIQQAKAKIPKYKADIESTKKMRNSLIEKANKVTDKYLNHESNIMNNFAEARKNEVSIHKVKNAADFKTVVEKYPDLKANEPTKKLLEQLEMSEKNLLQNRINYTESIANYNIQIHSFPFSIIRGIFKMDDMIIENEEENEIISDEELGI